MCIVMQEVLQSLFVTIVECIHMFGLSKCIYVLLC